MRHLVKGRKLNRTASHRIALKRNLAMSLIEHKTIKTTLPKAKELQGFIERLITYAKKEDLSSHRLITQKLPGKLGKKMSNILIHDIAPNYSGRNGGYTRIIKLDNRKNDNSKMSLIEFVNLEINPEGLDNSSSKKEEQEKKEQENQEKTNRYTFSELFKVITFEQFFSNRALEVEKFNIIEISKELKLSKETARRKVIEMEDAGIIKKNKKIIWLNFDAFNIQRPDDSIKSFSRLLASYKRPTQNAGNAHKFAQGPPSAPRSSINAFNLTSGKTVVICTFQSEIFAIKFGNFFIFPSIKCLNE